jgi:PAS domain S-box-containing protein
MNLPPMETSRPTTLRARMRRIILLVSALALVLASGAFLTYDYVTFRRTMESRLRVLSEVMATQTTPALAFNDPRVASEILGTLAATRQIECAAIYTRDGVLLTRYLRPGAPEVDVPRSPGSDGLRIEDGYLGLVRPMTANGERLGSIYVRSDLEEAAERLRMNALIVGLIFIVVLALSYVLSARLVGSITRPIAGLAEVVGAVTAKRDYSIRAQKQGPEEIMVLIEGMNDMFSQIQVRDGALQLARNELENRVRERTAELTFVNQELSSEIGERKRMESSLRESEERYRHLVELSPDAIMVHCGGKIQFVNGAAIRMFGAKGAGDLIGTLMIDRIAPEFREIVKNRMRLISELHQGTPPLEERLLRIDGSAMDGEVQGTPFIYQGQPAAQIVIRDISKRKEVERMKDEFVSTVSHELRTPLTSIQGSLGLIANGVMGALPVSAKPLIDIAYKNCSRLVLLINDILDSEKIAAGKMRFAFKDQELMPLVTQAIEANRSFGAQYGVRFELSETVPGARVDADSDRFAQVLTNLLSNAAKFSPRGDVVTISVKRWEDKLRITVSDRGPGIPAEFRDRIFQKFSQADSSDRRAKGGTGLGLSISKTIVEHHSGSLSFETQEGRGTSFFMDLPEHLSPLPADAPGKVKGVRVLICEDEPQVAELLRTLIERQGLQVDVVHNLHDAQESLGTKTYALMTLDLMLPDGDGVSFLHEMRGSERTRELPVLLISSLIPSASHLVGNDLNPVECLEKPVDAAKLIAAVKAGVARSSGQLEGAKT